MGCPKKQASSQNMLPFPLLRHHTYGGRGRETDREVGKETFRGEHRGGEQTEKEEKLEEVSD